MEVLLIFRVTNSPHLAPLPDRVYTPSKAHWVQTPQRNVLNRHLQKQNENCISPLDSSVKMIQVRRHTGHLSQRAEPTWQPAQDIIPVTNPTVTSLAVLKSSFFSDKNPPCSLTSHERDAFSIRISSCEPSKQCRVLQSARQTEGASGDSASPSLGDT